ncbi:probable peptidoglycan muropeptide transporter SLC46 [Diabrotica undecimpunctata]|uniref:probable peptidoglycan muropeptide transporter SLC46 n=1 Tax=Diabrotica undecimpunctata TaxID=50387 RepID=UPI003B633F50
MVFKFNFPVEIPLVLCSLSQTLLRQISSNLFIYRTCYVILQYDKSDCEQLGNERNNLTEWLEPLVQPTVNNIETVMRISESILPIFLSLFIGTLSDRLGRKPFLVMGIAGTTIHTLLNTFVAYYDDLSPWYFIFTSLPGVLVGGFSTTFVIITLYMADTTTPKKRVIRMGFFEAGMALSSIIGSLCSSYLFYATSYVTIYIISTSMMCVSLLYIIFLVPESLKIEKKRPSLTELMSVVNIKEILRVPFKKREGNTRYYILTLMGILVGYNFVMGGDMSLKTLFLRQKVHWTLSQITNSSVYSDVVMIVGTIFGTTILYKKLKMKELQLVVLSLVMSIVTCILYGLATSDIYIYAAYTIRCFGGLCTTMVRTLISFMVLPHELGKVYATSSAIDSVAQLLSSSIYPQIYNATINSNSGFFYFISMGIYGILALVILNLMRYEMPKPIESDSKKEAKDKEVMETKKKLSEV